jgi:predicted HAD superfamily Cof-like phosphohydrolase
MIPVDQVQEFRLQLIFEEFAELIEACGYDFQVVDKKLVLNKERATDLVEVADAFADISVVNVGGSIAFGLPFPEIITEVDRNNLAKFGPGGYRREDGKWIKPPDHKPPKIQEIVEKHLEKKDEV